MNFKQIFLILILFLNAFPAHSQQNIWDVLRTQLSLNHEINQPDVQNQLQWLISHPNYLHQLARSEPYMYHILTEIKRRGLPGELALLPMLESAYDPFAYSVVGAAGLWQLMPGTGTGLGLKQDWWYDGRRGIRSSTEAALNYLSYLKRFFGGNWQLAIAAYDSGEGTVSRAIKSSGQTGNINFWTLPVPAETKTYVPRLLALAEIIKYPEHYKVTLPDIPHAPYFAEVDIGSQIDLNHAAQLAGISYRDLIKLNPGFNRWATAPYKPFKLLIPANKVAHFNRNLLLFPQKKQLGLVHHLVRSGENINSIAHRYFTTANLIKGLNRLQSGELKPGQVILIPSTQNTPTRSTPRPSTLVHLQTYKVIHIIQSGETLQKVAKKYNVTQEKIQLWNQLKQGEVLSQGTQLMIWRNKTV